MTSRALVLASGGLAGVAWESGLLLGLHDTAPELDIAATATRFVGTSAGSVVASQVANRVDLEALFALQGTADAAVGARIDVATALGFAQQALGGATSLDDIKRRLGGHLRTGVGDQSVDRREIIRTRLLATEWPDTDLLVVATDVATTRRRVFDRRSGATLVDAVAASCAVPLVWPAVEIAGRLYVDGGLRSSTHADLAEGCDRVLILSPAPLAAAPGQFVVCADDDSVRAFGSNSLDDAVRPASAAAGRAQGRRIARSVADYWL